ncbi:hypothetical protein PF010_g2916 [Phytophthora fragariae]|uniref:Uncharacterized protein n=1 Tax=Phytophthora fragariae TaxID=53985 RepID=A0A6G0LWL9_9STRA|nr:hypothetical protein PF010_g2916 [Phytophthora fragariae]KAE9237997.1 hypothetical protein PF004_g8435 [Phytophthora fragariae]
MKSQHRDSPELEMKVVKTRRHYNKTKGWLVME